MKVVTRLKIAVALALGICAHGCAAQQPKPAEHAPPPAGAQVDAAPDAPPQAAAPAAAKPQICDAGTSESEVSEEILARSGRGLLWLVVPDRNDPDVKASRARGADEVRSARALAECLLRHHDAGFDATQSQGHEALVAWVDAHVGPEHAETLLAAGAAYVASLLVAESWIDAALDVPAARLFLERATASAPQLADGLGPLMLGAYECIVPKAVGGHPERGLQRLEEAAKHGGSLRLAMKVAAAELCAFSLQDRALFDRLLDEVEATKQVGSTFDLLSKERAKKLRNEVGELFPDQS
jgi:hypothetical protein